FLTGNVAIYQSATASAPGQNYVLGSDSKVDSMLKQLVVEPDTTKQADLANQIDTQLWNDMYTLPLYQKPTFLAFDSSYSGIGDNATSAGPLWNSDTFSVKQ
ncbi:MAG TPA: hypothetical protein VFX70_11125, partial [Mycobacteriales bacterium]|nr:hypothetical protein [Mycobacteriales bacterium]